MTSAAIGKNELSHQKSRVGHAKNYHFPFSQHEALRRATLLKHRKISTQLKLDMVQRQLTELKSSSSSLDRQFYRSQLSELSNELHDLGNTLEKVERNAFYARRRMLKCHDVNGGIQLSASHPAIYSSTDTLDQGSKNGIKNRMNHLMHSPTLRFKKKHLLGELRAVASLSSLNVKSTSHSSCDDITTKDTKTWKAPLRFLGHIVDNKICRKLWGSTKRVKSVDNLVDEKKNGFGSSVAHSKTFNGLRKDEDQDYLSTSSSPSESSDESEDESKDWNTRKASGKHIWKGPVERKLSNNQKQQIDPELLAEIEDFEKMAAQYIKLHS